MFALSLFGAFDLVLPSGLVTRLDALSRSRSLPRDGATLLMEATFAVTSFTCTAPFVGTLLVSVTQGSWRWPALGLLIFSGVFALPFVVLALVPSALSKLPRSGPWMVTLKGTLAFVEARGGHEVSVQRGSRRGVGCGDPVGGDHLLGCPRRRPCQLSLWSAGQETAEGGRAVAADSRGARPRRNRVALAWLGGPTARRARLVLAAAITCIRDAFGQR